MMICIMERKCSSEYIKIYTSTERSMLKSLESLENKGFQRMDDDLYYGE